MKKILLLIVFLSTSTFGAGVTSHRFISKKSLDYIRDANVKAMLQRNYRLFLAATMLPDMGYLLSAFKLGDTYWWGEDLHWAPFINGLWNYNQAKCRSAGWPPRNSSECEKLWTIYFGILSHSIADIQWHGGYIYRFSIMEHGANNGKFFDSAHSIADNMGDLPAVHSHGERDLTGSMDYNLMTTIINDYAKSRNKVGVNTNQLTAAFAFQEAWYWGIKVGWPIYYYFKLKYKWGHDNYLGTLGGIDNTARRLAELTDMISWENQRLSLSRRTNLATGGNWPHNFFNITKADGSATVNKAFHDPSYQFVSGSSFNCRWGLFLGGWKWFEYGQASKCPFKGTPDYQKAQCERFRYWPLSCKPL